MRMVEVYGNIKDGRLKIAYRDRFLAAVKQLPDCIVRLRLERIYNKRSLPQNAYYWGVVVYEFCRGFYETTGEGLTTDHAHDILKHKFLFREVMHPNLEGKYIQIPGSTTNLDTSEFETYLERCRAFILEWFGISVPLHNEEWNEEIIDNKETIQE